jgi:hypothetical protein
MHFFKYQAGELYAEAVPVKRLANPLAAFQGIY